MVCNCTEEVFSLLLDKLFEVVEADSPLAAPTPVAMVVSSKEQMRLPLRPSPSLRGLGSVSESQSALHLSAPSSSPAAIIIHFDILDQVIETMLRKGSILQKDRFMPLRMKLGSACYELGKRQDAANGIEDVGEKMQEQMHRQRKEKAEQELSTLQTKAASPRPQAQGGTPQPGSEPGNEEQSPLQAAHAARAKAESFLAMLANKRAAWPPSFYELEMFMIEVLHDMLRRVRPEHSTFAPSVSQNHAAREQARRAEARQALLQRNASAGPQGTRTIIAKTAGSRNFGKAVWHPGKIQWRSPDTAGLDSVEMRHLEDYEVWSCCSRAVDAEGCSLK